MAALFAWAAFAFAPPAFGQGTGGDAKKTPSPKTIIILTSGLDWAELQNNSDLHEVLQSLAGEGGVALLNPAVSGEATEAAAFLSVGAGERMAAPGKSGPVLWESETARSIADFAREAVTRRGDDDNPSADEALYRTRMGVGVPQNAAVFHLGVAPIQNAQPDTRRAALVGALGTVLQNAGQTVAVWGDYRAALAGMTAQGTVPLGTASPDATNAQSPEFLQTVQTADVTLINAPNSRTFAAFIRAVMPLVKRGSANVLAASVAPPVTGGKWTSLGFVAAGGPHFRSAFSPGLLVSPTTRTPGLTANVDIAPTVFQMQGIEQSAFVSGAGRTMRFVAVRADPFVSLTIFDRQVRGAAKATIPVLVGWGTLAFAGAFVAVLGAALKSRRLAFIAQAMLLVSSAVFLALLPVGIAPPAPTVLYAAFAFPLSAALASAAFLVGKRLKKSPLGLVFALTVLVVALDALWGSPLISRSALSGYFLSGVRFYGVGNEYMGVLIGAFLCGFGLLLPIQNNEAAPRRVRGMFAFAALCLCLLIGLPVLGANAGGAVACAFAFGCAFWALGGRLRVWHIGLSLGVAAAFVACLALTDAFRVGGAQSHIGAAAATGAQSGGWQKLTALVYGKIAMNARLTASPFAVAALALFVPLFGWLRAGRVGESVRDSLAKRPALRRVLPAVFWGAGAAFVFNDSGIVAALLIFACITASVLVGVCDLVIADVEDAK